MASFLDFFIPTPSLQDLSLLPYTTRFSLEALRLGVDNIHHDVQVSPRLRRAVNRAALFALARRCDVEELVDSGGAAEWKTVREAFLDRCRQVLTAGVHAAKSRRQIQIDYLAQAAVAKLLRRCIEGQYEKILEKLEQLLRSHELSVHQNFSLSVTIKEKLTWIRQHREETLRAAAVDLFGLFSEASRRVDTLREANFGKNPLLPPDFFSNPMFYADTLSDDYFLIDNYTLLSHRFEDPDSYERLMTILSDFLQTTDLGRERTSEGDGTEEDPAAELSGYWMQPENVDLLFDAAATEAQLRELPPGKDARPLRRQLRQRRRLQRRLLGRMYRNFRRAGLIFRVCAGFEVGSLVGSYCPPLIPQQILRYLVEPASRKPTLARLNRLKGFYGKSFSVSPLHRSIRRAKSLPKAKKQARLLEFLRQLTRYHRDSTHYRQAKKAMDAIQLDPDERTVLLSRENRTLYDFMLEDERGKEEQPVIGHVIIKADVRGSTDLTYRMRTEGLNPASFFSLNLFDPITELLFDYDAAKEFIEGDALILSIFEQKETPEGWYSVGRACGLAMRILQVVEQSNIKSRRHRLPILELGIGICYDDSAPAFLFDAGGRIMISPAINSADRLSGCSKALRKLIERRKLPFNLYVFQTVSEKERGSTADDLFFRYNVNGIELNAGGFEKLSREINLVPFDVSLSADGKQPAHRFYAGKVPLVHGSYQTLVIREAPVFDVSPDTLKICGKTPHWYYEVCTHPRLYEKAAQAVGIRQAAGMKAFGR